MISDMILDGYLPKHYSNNIPLMRHILAATFVTPSLLSLFDVIIVHYSNKKILRLTADTRNACKDFRNHSYAKVPMDKSVLKLAGDLYALYDDVVTISCLDDKIKVWKMANAIACRQFHNAPPYKIQILDTIVPVKHKNTPSVDTVADKLIEYAADCQIWLNGQYIDNDDNEVTEIIIKLHLLAKMLRNFHKEQTF